jgi:UDP:flavonoid glycosyltransferase YjiC (YdhE family)
MFLQKLQMDHFVLPDIQEQDEAGLPTVEWFRDPQYIIDCINAEVDLFRKYSPDRILGLFRFTVKASAQLAGIPYDSLICGCMIPDSQEVLGFADGEPGRAAQQIILNGFYRYAAIKTSIALTSFGLDEITDVRNMLKGERTFLWDFPEFFPLPQSPDIIHIGPITWNHWDFDDIDVDAAAAGNTPLALVAFGTCMSNVSTAKRIIKILLDLGYRVVFAAGGQKEFLDTMLHESKVTVCKFAPMNRLLPLASLLICHGGQMTVFEALRNNVPVFVMPFQPEQSHSGVCLERIGCGRRLVPSQIFQGNSEVYIDALTRVTENELKSVIDGLVNNPQTKKRLSDIEKAIERCEGLQKLSAMFEAV